MVKVPKKGNKKTAPKEREGVDVTKSDKFSWKEGDITITPPPKQKTNKGGKK